MRIENSGQRRKGHQHKADHKDARARSEPNIHLLRLSAKAHETLQLILKSARKGAPQDELELFLTRSVLTSERPRTISPCRPQFNGVSGDPKTAIVSASVDTPMRGVHYPAVAETNCNGTTQLHVTP